MVNTMIEYIAEETIGNLGGWRFISCENKGRCAIRGFIYNKM